MKMLALIGSAVTLVMSMRFAKRGEFEQVRVSGADPALARSA